LRGRHPLRRFFILFGLVLWGCPDPHRRPDDFSADPAPLIAKIKARADAVNSLTGQLKLEVWRDGERVKLRQLVAVQHPDKLRIDLLSPFEQPLVTLTSDGRTLSIYDLEKKRFSQGRASKGNLARLIPVKLAPDSLGALLRGSLPIIQYENATVGWDGQNGWYQLDLQGKTRRQRIHLEPKAFRVVQAREWLGDTLVYTARLGDYSSAEDTALPQRMRLTAPGDIRVDAVVEDHRVNVELPPEAFVLTPPVGIPVEPLD
jgi:outer membrane lipoprotein-sorting protein